MIPKIIHYIWLSGEKIPHGTKDYISTWSRFFPDYKIKCWDQNAFNINSVPFVKEAVTARKWASASDYIRLYALFTEGGLYFDSDILVKRSFESFFTGYDFFSAVEYHPGIVNSSNMNLYLDENYRPLNDKIGIPGIGLQAALMGSIPQHPFLKDCMTWYENNHFIHGNTYNTNIIAPGLYAKCAENYGFIYKDIEQELKEKMYIVPSNIVASSATDTNENNFAIHYCKNSWVTKTFITKVKEKIKRIGQISS
jgi:mannosyltransferase OCH1-like enzyme